MKTENESRLESGEETRIQLNKLGSTKWGRLLGKLYSGEITQSEFDKVLPHLENNNKPVVIVDDIAILI